MKNIYIFTSFLCLFQLSAQAAIVTSGSSSVTAGTNVTVSGSAVSIADPLSLSTATITNLVATTTNNNALVTSYGYSVSSVTAANTPYPTTTQYGDMLALTLSAGDWLCYGSCFASANGATTTESTCGISQTTGNSSTGLVPGDSYAEGTGPTAASPVSFSVLTRQSLSGSTIVYLKYEATFSVATPQARGKLFCWKPR